MIKEDKSYLSSDDLLAIEKGFAVLDIHAIRINAEKSIKEEKVENLRIHNTMTEEEWNKHCDLIQESISSKIKYLVGELSEKFRIYRHKDDKMDYKSNWDLFFRCNSGDDEERDCTYLVTLTTNSERTLEERLEGINQVLEAIKEIGFNELEISVEYAAKYDYIKIKDIVDNYFEKVKNTFIQYSGHEGKIKEGLMDHHGNKCYRFYKNGTRSKYHSLSSEDMLMLSLR